MIDRREIVLSLAAAVAMPRVALAQSQRPALIGFLGGATDVVGGLSRTGALRDGLLTLGLTDQVDYRIEARWQEGYPERARKLADELVALRPSVIVGISTPVTRALKQATRDIPIVFTTVSDPIGEGLVASLAKPGGNVTGFMSYDWPLATKWLQLLKEVGPSLTRVAILYNPSTAPAGGREFLAEAGRAAPGLGLTLLPTAIATETDLASALSGLAERPSSGLLVMPDSTTQRLAPQITDGALRHRLPAVYPLANFVPLGGLIVYGVDIADQVRDAATYVARILKGEKPGDLPVQAPTKLQLTVNLKTARALGLTIPPSILIRADEVIE